MERVNWETNSREGMVETAVSLPLGGETFTFRQPLPRYVHEKLTREDWEQAGRELRDHARSVVRRLVLSGVYLAAGGAETAKRQVMEGMRSILLHIFQAKQIKAGNLEWALPETLAPERYR